MLSKFRGKGLNKNESVINNPIGRFISKIVAGQPFKISDLKERITIIIQKNDYVEKKMILMLGEYDRYGKHCARVYAGKSSFLVDRTPQQLLSDTFTSVDSNVSRASGGAKISHSLGVCLFPSKSPEQFDCIWFNPEQILKTTASGTHTKVYLQNGYSIMVETKQSIFNKRWQAATQLWQLSLERDRHPSPILFYLEPNIEQKIAKKKADKINVDCLEEEE